MCYRYKTTPNKRGQQHNTTLLKQTKGGVLPNNYNIITHYIAFSETMQYYICTYLSIIIP